MKNTTALIAAVLLGGLGFVSMLAMMNRSSNSSSRIEEPKHLTKIVVARKDLRAGQVLTLDHTDLQEMPGDYVSSFHIEESQRNIIFNRVLRSAVKAGEPILIPSLEPVTQTASVELESLLKDPDTHAISIELDGAQTVAGLLKAGQKVDLIGSFEIETKGTDKDGKEKTSKFDRTLFIAQNRTILAIDVRTSSRYENDPKEVVKHVVTLAVTPEEALKMAHLYSAILDQKASGHLALRNRINGQMSAAQIGSEELLRISIPR